MNNLEKNSFYSFLALYIISSVAFILLSFYWYYNAQKTSLQSNTYYKLQHIADTISKKIIQAHMQGYSYTPKFKDQDIKVSLVNTKDKVVYGDLDFIPSKEDYYTKKGVNTLISNSPQEHLDIKYVVVQSQILRQELQSLIYEIFTIGIISIVIMIILAYFLSKLFMKPIHQKISQIESFVHDTTHELNTPITALKMSVSRALKKQSYDEKILKNISISTKQLFDIYSALTYLSFESKTKNIELVDVCNTLKNSVEYYKELAQSKNIELDLECEEFSFKIEQTKLTMLFGNLINNSIKYSHPNSKIEISLKDGILKVKDYGIGIQNSKLEQIFQRFNRETTYAGGFGIGLSIVDKVAKEYKLEIKVYSKIDEGSSFLVYF